MRHALLTVAWTLLLGSPASACSCAPPIDCYSVSPASRSPSSGPAFVGTVLEVTVLEVTERSPTPSFLDRVQVKFRLDEPLSALPVGLREMEVFTGQGGGDCGIPFTPGERYLVLSHLGPDGRAHTGFCSGTRPVREAAAALRTLRQSRDRQPLPALTGQLRQLSPTGEQSTPVARTSVQVTVAGQVFRTTTDADGIYAFRDLPAGQFTLATGAISPEIRATRGTITQHRCVQRDLYVLPPAPQP